MILNIKGFCMFFVFLLYALFASVFTIQKVSLNYASPLFIIGSRMAFAGIIMIIYQLIKNRKSFKLDVSGFVGIVLFAILGIYITNVCELWSLKYLTSSKACFLYSATPFISAFFSFLILKESMTRKKWLGLIIGFVGLAPILLSQGAGESSVGGVSIFSWPELALITATTASCLGWILLRQSVTSKSINLFVANGLGMFIGGLVTLGHSYAVETWNPVPVFEFVPYLETSLALLVVSNLAAYNLYGYLLKRYSATFMAFAGLSTPFFAAIFGWVFLKEIVPWPFWLGLLVLSSGLLLFHREEMQAKGFQIKQEKSKA